MAVPVSSHRWRAQRGVCFMGGVAVLGRPHPGTLERRTPCALLRAARVHDAGGSGLAVALVLLIAAPTRHGLAAPMIVLVGFGYGPIFPNMIAVGATRFPSEVGRMTSVVVAGGALGGIFVPWIMGHAIMVASPRAAMELALGITALMAFISIAGLRTCRQP